MLRPISSCLFFFFFNDTATTEIYTLSLHDALPISSRRCGERSLRNYPAASLRGSRSRCSRWSRSPARSEEHTSELQSQSNLVCRLLLEKKKKQNSFRMRRRVDIATSHRTIDSYAAY